MIEVVQFARFAKLVEIIGQKSKINTIFFLFLYQLTFRGRIFAVLGTGK